MEAVEEVKESSVQGLRIGLYLMLNIAGYIVWSQHLFEPVGIAIFYIVLATISIVFEWRTSKHRYFSMPPAIFSIYAYIQIILAGYFNLEFGAGEWMYFDGDPEVVNRTAIYSFMAVSTLWISFYFFPNMKTNFFKNTNFTGVSKRTLYIMVGLSLFALFVGIRLGIYGYSAQEDGSAVIFYIRYCVNLGLLAIILIILYYYDDPVYRRLVFFLVVLYFFAGVAFGSKSTAVAPILFFAVAFYLTGRKIKWTFLIWGALGLAFAFTVIEPFRMYYHFIGDKYDTTNPVQLVKMFNEAYDLSKELEDDEKADMVGMLTSRQNNIPALAMTIQYADKNNYYAEGEFMHLFLSPLYTIVPRFMWTSKPRADIGHWVSTTIYGSSEENSIGITPQGYAYLIAREWGIVFFFIIYGLLQRFLFNTFFLNKKFLALYVLIFFDIGYPSELPWAFVSGCFRLTLMMIPMFYIIMKKEAKGNALQAG